MFIVAVFFGFYSYLLFALGLLGLLYKPVIIILTTLLVGIFLFWQIRLRKNFFQVSRLFQLKKKHGGLFFFLFILFFVQAGVNLIAALGPELGFDALWYHLTLPKLYLLEHSIFYIPGGLFYYSAMPKLAEMLFMGGLAFGDETFVKLIHFSFGLLCSLALYKIQRKFFTPFIALLGVIIFYSNLVVAWESGAAYVDLIRTFYEIMAMWGFLNWLEKKKQKWLFISAVMLGFAITTKLLAMGSLFIFTILLLVNNQWHRETLKDSFVRFLKNVIPFWFIALFIPLPWFLFSFINTGNPIYPIFSPVFHDLNAKIFSLDLFNPVMFLQTAWNIAVRAADPISPIYIIVLPLIILFGKKIAKMKVFFIYAAISFILWYVTAKVEGSRLLLPGLTAMTVIVAAIVNELLQSKKYYQFGKILIILIIFISCISIGYRFVANKKYIPVIFGQQTKEDFLIKNLNYSFGDFYDVDGYFKKTIKPTETVLLNGFHNIYYVQFKSIDLLDARSGKPFDYIATQKAALPEEFSDWKLIYQNDKTLVKLYIHP